MKDYRLCHARVFLSGIQADDEWNAPIGILDSRTLRKHAGMTKSTSDYPLLIRCHVSHISAAALRLVRRRVKSECEV